MMVTMACDVTPKVLPSGHLALRSEATGTQRRYGPTETAMWIALNQNEGELERAAETLAVLWGSDPTAIYDQMSAWVAELREVGLLAGVA